MTPGPRISKDPEVRREEFIDAAESLFEEKGYDETSVSDIVNKVGVAQGTFYHYFISKEMVLEAFVDRLVIEILVKMNAIVNDPGKDAVEKMVLITRTSMTFTMGRERMTDLIHEDRYAPLHHKLERRILPPIIELITRIIEQGNGEGLFDIPYSREAAIAVMGISQQFGEGKFDGKTRRKVDQDELVRMVEIVERILGMRRGLFMECYKEMMV